MQQPLRELRAFAVNLAASHGTGDRLVKHSLASRAVEPQSCAKVWYYI
jgi:hypothetical protein